MILSLKMPAMGGLMRSGVVERVGVVEGAEIAPGSRLVDVRVDLGAVAPQDCPPVSFFRVVSRERAWIRRLSASVGDVRGVGEVLVLASTDPGEPLDGAPARPLRVATAGIASEPDWLAPVGD